MTPPFVKVTNADIKKYENLVYDRVHTLCRKLPVLKQHEEDLRQEGFIGLLKAFETYRPDRGTVFMTWAWRAVKMYVENAALSYRSAFGTKQRRPPPRRMAAEEADDFFRGLAANDPSPESAASTRQLATRLATKLTEFGPKQADILRGRVSVDRYERNTPDSLPNLGRKYGISKQAVVDIEQSALKKIRAWGAEIEAEAA